MNTIPMSIVDRYHKNLINNHIIQKGVTDLGFSIDTIQRFKLGYDEHKRCLTIPIIEGAICYNIKFYSRKQHPKYFSYKDDKGNTYGKSRLWGIDVVRQSQEILICAGEKDRMMAIQHGYTAVCSTTGEAHWNSGWNDTFKSKVVSIVFDNDETGQKGAKKIASQLSDITTVKIIDISSICTEQGEDLFDFFIKYKKTKRDLDRLIKSEDIVKLNNYQITSVTEPEWPVPRPEIFYGIAGNIIKKIEPHTESDPVAILIQLLVIFGNIVDRHAFYQVEATQHYSNLFAIITGASSKARKGTSFNHVKRIFDQVVPDWINNNISSGLRSGEALIWEIRDESINKKDDHVSGIDDKRRLFLESEFAFVLKTLDTQGNLISVVLRQAWDSATLKNTTKHTPSTATNPHVSFIGHITLEEVKRYLTLTESANGFANRFLWVCSKRSKELPYGGSIEDVDFTNEIKQLKLAIEFSKAPQRLCLSTDAKKSWSNGVYSKLSGDSRLGIFGAVTSRAEAQVIRLALIYALLDRSSEIQKVHLDAALAVWDYCEHSAKIIFGDSVGDSIADKILSVLKSTPEGLTLTEIQRLFSNNKTKAKISHALDILARQNLTRNEIFHTKGRSVQKWFLK